MTKTFFGDFLYKNIWPYQILIYNFEQILAPKIAFWAHFSSFWSYFHIWMSYMHIILYEHSYDIIGQKSSISQKFRQHRAPLEYQKNEKNWKYFVVYPLFSINRHILPFRGAQCCRNFCPMYDFWNMIPQDAIRKKNRIKTIFWWFFIIIYFKISHFLAKISKKFVFFLYFLCFDTWGKSSPYFDETPKLTHPA